MYIYLYKHTQVLGKGNGTPLQYSCLENPMDGGAWKAAVHGVTESGTQLSDFTFTFHIHASEKEMATHSGVPAWRIPEKGEPGGLPSIGLHRVGHHWSDLAAAAAILEWSIYKCQLVPADCLLAFLMTVLSICSMKLTEVEISNPNFEYIYFSFQCINVCFMHFEVLLLVT